MSTSKTTQSKTQKAAQKKSAAPAKTPPQKTSPEQKVAESVLKLVDQVAATLRKNVRAGATEGEKARALAYKNAHALLTKAHDTLSKNLDQGTSVLKKAIKKIEP